MLSGLINLLKMRIQKSKKTDEKKEHRTEPTKFTIAVYQKTVTDRLLANIITD